MMRRYLPCLLALLALAACGKGPPTSDMRDRFELTQLPGMVKLESFGTDQVRDVGSDESPAWMARYTAEIALKEDTFEIDTVLDGRPLLKPVHGAGQRFKIYGNVTSRRSGDRWNHQFQTDGSSNPVLGRLRSDYSPDALIAGSPEAEALRREHEQAQERLRIAEETRRAQEAAEIRAREEAEAALRKRIEDAVARHGAEFAPETLGRIGLDRTEHIGKTYHFLVRDLDPTGNKTAWGSDVYSYDSDFAKVVVHAGLLEPGETGIVSATMLGNHRRFAGSPRNGVNTESHSGEYRAYRVALVERISVSAANGQ